MISRVSLFDTCCIFVAQKINQVSRLRVDANLQIWIFAPAVGCDPTSLELGVGLGLQDTEHVVNIRVELPLLVPRVAWEVAARRRYFLEKVDVVRHELVRPDAHKGGAMLAVQFTVHPELLATERSVGEPEVGEMCYGRSGGEGAEAAP